MQEKVLEMDEKEVKRLATLLYENRKTTIESCIEALKLVSNGLNLDDFIRAIKSAEGDVNDVN